MNKNTIQKIAILTSGGDSPGMNSAINAIVRSSLSNGIEPFLVYEGYKGLIDKNIEKASIDKIKGYENKGGTLIYSARFPEFKEEKIRKIAVSNLNEMGINALVAIGGDGTYMGASKLSSMGIKTVALPGTIDNDISTTDFTIGFDTALNTIVDSIEKAKDTSLSHNRCNVIEIMGRYCGDLTINAAIATSANVMSCSERKLSEQDIIKKVSNIRKNGVRDIIILVTEHLYDISKLAKKIELETGIETKHTVLGHIQRGGNPSAFDKVLATKMGVFAVKQILSGKTNIAINYVNGKLETKELENVVKTARTNKDELISYYELIK